MSRGTITSLLVLVLVQYATLGTSAEATVTYHKMDVAENECGKEFEVKVGNEAIVTSSGDAPDRACKIRYRGEVKDNCNALCVNIKQSTFRECSVTLYAKSGNKHKEYDCADLPEGPWCGDETELSLEVVEAEDFVPTPKNPGYSFTAAVYNKCGHNAGDWDGDSSGDAPTFEQAAKALDGFHHDDFEERVKRNYIEGILLGFGLSCIFLVVLLITYCYYKHSPDRGPSMNVGMPSVSFKKTFKVGGLKKKDKEADLEEGVFKYNIPRTEKAETKAEAKPLLATPPTTVASTGDDSEVSKNVETPIAIKIDPVEESPKRKDSTASSKSTKSVHSDGGGDGGGGESGGGDSGGGGGDGGDKGGGDGGGD